MGRMIRLGVEDIVSMLRQEVEGLRDEMDQVWERLDLVYAALGMAAGEEAEPEEVPAEFHYPVKAEG